MTKIKIGKYLSRLKNPVVVMGIAGYLITILNNLGFAIDSEVIYNIVQGGSGILILLGIMNNPDEAGIDIPSLNPKDN